MSRGNIVKPYPIRTLRSGPLNIACADGAWPLQVREDGGQLVIHLLEDTGAKMAVLGLYLVELEVIVRGYLDADQHVGSASVGGVVWHVFEGLPKP